MSPYLARSVVGFEDAHFCKHKGVDWGALREVLDDAADGEWRGAARPSPSRSRRTCSCGTAAAWSARGWNYARALDRPRVAEAAGVGNLPQHCRNGLVPGSSAPSEGAQYAFGRSAADLSQSPRGRRCRQRSCPIRLSEAPARPVRGAAAVRKLHGLRQCSGGAAGAKIAAIRPIPGRFLPRPASAFLRSFLYKRGLTGIAACAPYALSRVRISDVASATPLEDTVMAVPRRKTSSSRRGMRRSADALKTPTYVEDKDFR